MKLISIILVIAVIWIGVSVVRTCLMVTSYNRLAQNASKVVSGRELLAWATNLLAVNPTGTNLTPPHWGTNFPKQLLGLCPRLGPHVIVYEGGETNSPSWVRVAWGSAGMGASGFEIGPTNFVSLQPGHEWQPGVYFFKR